jgi:hypothetical protein
VARHIPGIGNSEMFNFHYWRKLRDLHYFNPDSDEDLANFRFYCGYHKFTTCFLGLPPDFTQYENFRAASYSLFAKRAVDQEYFLGRLYSVMGPSYLRGVDLTMFSPKLYEAMKKHYNQPTSVSHGHPFTIYNKSLFPGQGNDEAYEIEFLKPYTIGEAETRSWECQYWQICHEILLNGENKGNTNHGGCRAIFLYSMVVGFYLRVVLLSCCGFLLDLLALTIWHSWDQEFGSPIQHGKRLMHEVYTSTQLVRWVQCMGFNGDIMEQVTILMENIRMAISEALIKLLV